MILVYAAAVMVNDVVQDQNSHHADQFVGQKGLASGSPLLGQNRDGIALWVQYDGPPWRSVLDPVALGP